MDALILTTDEFIYSRIRDLLAYDYIDDNVESSLGFYLAAFPVLFSGACTDHYEYVYGV